MKLCTAFHLCGLNGLGHLRYVDVICLRLMWPTSLPRSREPTISTVMATMIAFMTPWFLTCSACVVILSGSPCMRLVCWWKFNPFWAYDSRCWCYCLCSNFPQFCNSWSLLFSHMLSTQLATIYCARPLGLMMLFLACSNSIPLRTVLSS